MCKSTACVNTSADTAYTDIHNNNVPSLGLEQQHEELCSNTPRGNAFTESLLRSLINNGKTLSYDINHAMRKFYASTNSVFSHAGSVSEISKLYLLESYCLPILTYAVEGLPLKKNQIGKFNTCWNNAYRKIFRMKKWESVRELQSLCGRDDLKSILETRRQNFFCQLYDSSNSLVKVCYIVHVLR